MYIFSFFYGRYVQDKILSVSIKLNLKLLGPDWFKTDVNLKCFTTALKIREIRVTDFLRANNLIFAGILLAIFWGSKLLM